MKDWDPTKKTIYTRIWDIPGLEEGLGSHKKTIYSRIWGIPGQDGEAEGH